MSQELRSEAGIRTPDRRLRVFVSSTLGELAEERRAVSRAISALRLTVAETNVAAQRLYARAGFHVVDGSASYDRGQRALRMVRPLL